LRYKVKVKVRVRFGVRIRVRVRVGVRSRERVQVLGRVRVRVRVLDASRTSSACTAEMIWNRRKGRTTAFNNPFFVLLKTKDKISST
jgi:hypothetical protein